jgi:hypothetical protein
MTKPTFLILCLEGPPAEALLWWKPNRRGYTTDVDAAGRYTREEAQRIVAGNDREDLAIPEEEALRSTKRIVVHELGVLARLKGAALNPLPAVDPSP